MYYNRLYQRPISNVSNVIAYFRLKCYITNVLKFYRYTRKVNFPKFGEDINFINRVLGSHIIRYDFKAWWRHILVKNIGITLKLIRFPLLIVAIVIYRSTTISRCRISKMLLASFQVKQNTWSQQLLDMKHEKRNFTTCKVSILYQFIAFTTFIKCN